MVSRNSGEQNTMPTPRMKPPKTASPEEARAAEPKPARPVALETNPPNLTSLLTACFKFDGDADNESRQLLLDTIEYWYQWQGPFAIVMTSRALRTLGVNVGVDHLEESGFLELLNLFMEAVSGYGYGGLREKLIVRL